MTVVSFPTRIGGQLDWLDDPGEDVDQELAAELAKSVRDRLGDDEAVGPRDQQARARRAKELAEAEIEYLSSRRQRDGAQHLTEAAERELLQDVLDRVLAQGRLTRLLRRDDVVNIHAVGTASVFIDLTDGRTVRAGPLALDEGELLRSVQEWARRLGVSGERQLNEEHPTLNLQLPDHSRLFAVFGLSERMHLFVRKHHYLKPTLDDLVDTGMLTPEIADFLEAVVKARLNILVVGGMDVGKTTLLRALCNAIPPTERIVTVETDYELGLDQWPDLHPDMTPLEARKPNVEGVGEVTCAHLVQMAMRMAATRIIVGEVLGDEVIPMLRAMNAGARGSMCTLHANSPHEAFATLGLLGVLAPRPVDPVKVEQLAASALDLVIYLDRDEGGRFISSIGEVCGWGEAGPATSELFEPGPDRRALRNEVPMSERTRRRLSVRAASQVDAALGGPR